MELLNEVLLIAMQKAKENLILAKNAMDNDTFYEAERKLGKSYAYSEVVDLIRKQKIMSNQLDEK